MNKFSIVILVFTILYYWAPAGAESCGLTCPRFRATSKPEKDSYLVQPSPVQFTIEPQDLVFFTGSDISLYCETNCVQLGLTNTSCSVGFLYNGCDLDYFDPFDNTLSDNRDAGRRTLTIHNANSSAIGRYQCFTYSPKLGRLPLTDKVIGRPVHLQVAALEPIGEGIQIVNASEGGSIELPCIKGVFPSPSNISWWRNEDRCDSVQCLENTEVLPSGTLALTNVTINISGDYFYCEVGWNDDMTYNATYQIIIISSMNSTDNHLIRSMKPPLKSKLPTIVALNATIDYVSEGTPIYYKSDLLVDLLNVDDYLINITITCTFSGHPRPQVKWFLNGLNISECIESTNINIVTERNMSILYFTTTNSKSYFGSYQCVVDNEVGYASNTTRILPKGWSNPPEILSVRFHNTDITLKWKSPDYTGAEKVEYYSIAIKNLMTNDVTVLSAQTKNDSYTFDGIEDFYGFNGDFYVHFTIQAVKRFTKIPISDIAKIELDTRPNKLKPEITTAECTEKNVIVKWINHNQDTYSNIYDYCVHYNCSTTGGAVTDKECTPALSRDNGFRDNEFRSREMMKVDNVPLIGNCSFRVMVFTDGYTYRWSNYETCTRNLSLPVVISKIMDQVHTKGNAVTFTCQATSEPVSSIDWYFNSILVNQSDKYQISTEALKYNSRISTLRVNSLESSDVGTYTCYAANGDSTDSSSGVLSLNVAPVITMQEVEQAFNVTEGDSITCTATGYPVPDIVWLNNDGSVVDKSRVVTGSVMAVGVGNVSSVSVSMIVGRSDSGVYKCLATNSVGNNANTINITVHSIPIITILEEYTVTEGDSITCTATGYPEPDIVWLNNDGSVVDKNRLVTDSEITTGVGNPVKVNVSMTVRRNDSGVYKCVANNSVGNNTSIINITVNSIPIITVPEEYNIIVIEGDNITCTATGYPEPDIVWLNTNGSVVYKNRSSILSTYIGNIFSKSVSMVVRRDDGGNYACVANNSIGNDISNISVTVNLLDEAVHSTSNVPIWVGVFLSVLFLSLLIFLLIVTIMWNRQNKYRAKAVIINQLKDLDGDTDYDKLPKDDNSSVETLSIMSNNMSRISIETSSIIEMISKSPPWQDIYPFLDIDSDNMGMSSNFTCASHDHYTTTKLCSSAITSDSAATSDSSASTGNTTIDSGIDSHDKFPV